MTESAHRPGAKQGLYPPAYHQADNYPPPDIATWSADAYTYMPPNWLGIKVKWGEGILAKPKGYSGKFKPFPETVFPGLKGFRV